MYPEYGRVYPPATSTFKSVRGRSSGIGTRDLYKSSEIVVMDEPLSISAYVSAPFMVMLDSLEWPISLSKKLCLIGLGWRLSPVCPSTETPSSFPNSIWKFYYPFSLSFCCLCFEMGYMVAICLNYLSSVFLILIS